MPQAIQAFQGSQESQESLPAGAVSITEDNRGLLPEIASIKLNYSKQTQWGQLYAARNDPEVMQFAWRDGAVVLFMSTVHHGLETVIRNRKRPKNADSHIQAAWGDSYAMDKPIPVFIDDYNHSMNMVDVADQIRVSHATKRKCFKTWAPLWHYILDTTMGNAAKIWTSTGLFTVGPHHEGLHRAFRLDVAKALMKLGRSSAAPQPKQRPALAPLAGTNVYCLLGKLPRRGECLACQIAKRKAMPRKVLGEISGNQPKLRPPRTNMGCTQCDISLCDRAICWEDHSMYYHRE